MTVGQARCATHPDVEAIATCARCGDFICHVCRAEGELHHCARCASRFAGFAWEQEGGFVERLIKTLVELVLVPSCGFPGPARVRPALSLLALYAMATVGQRALSFAQSQYDMSSIGRGWNLEWELFYVPLLWSLGTDAVVVAVSAALFTLASRGAVRSGWRAGTRAACFAMAVGLLRVPFGLLPMPSTHASPNLVILVRVFWIVVHVVFFGLTLRIWYAASRGTELRGARRWGAFALGSLLTVLTNAVLLGVSVAYLIGG